MSDYDYDDDVVIRDNVQLRARVAELEAQAATMRAALDAIFFHCRFERDAVEIFCRREAASAISGSSGRELIDVVREAEIELSKHGEMAHHESCTHEECCRRRTAADIAARLRRACGEAGDE